MHSLRTNAVLASVFLTGGSLLIVEVVATRILSPYFAAESPTARGTQNLILVGVNGTTLPSLDSPTVAENPEPLIRSLPARRVPVEQIDFSLFWDLTDDYAPVEYLTVQSALRVNTVESEEPGEEPPTVSSLMPSRG